jgi:hypothetical protein
VGERERDGSGGWESQGWRRMVVLGFKSKGEESGGCGGGMSKRVHTRRDASPQNDQPGLALVWAMGINCNS